MKISGSFLINAALRLSALGGKFIFILIAASAMPAEDFGRVGIALATSVIIIAMIGLEAYQVLLRKIVQGEAVERSLARGFYFRFALVGSIVSGLIAAVCFWSMGWRHELVLLAAIVVMADHLNSEICRVLVGESHPTLAILAMSARTGLWAIALPILSFVGLVPSKWSDVLVLGAWLCCSLLGSVCFSPLARIYLHAGGSRVQVRRLASEILATSAVWVTVSFCWRALDTGGRLIVGYLEGDAMSGQFTLLSTLASFSLVALKGILEPIYFPRIVGPDGDAQLMRFSTHNVLLVVLTAAGTIGAALIYEHVAKDSGFLENKEDWIALVVLTLAYAIMCFSQIWHFRLYREHKDKAILGSSVLGAIVGIGTAAYLTKPWGLAGTAVGLTAGALVLLMSKAWSSRNINFTR